MPQGARAGARPGSSPGGGSGNPQEANPQDAAASQTASQATEPSFDAEHSVDLPGAKGTHKKGLILTTLQGHSGQAKIVRYDFQQLLKIGPFMTCFMQGTVFNLEKSIFLHILVYSVLFAIAAIYTLVQASSPTFDAVFSMTDNLQRFCPFLFGMFVSVMLNRWWTMRTDGIGNVADHIINVSCFLISNGARKLPKKEDWELFIAVHAKVVKYGIASLTCIAQECRGNTGLSGVLSMGLITEHEKGLLESPIQEKAASTVLWCWMGTLSAELMEMVSLPPPNVNMLYNEIRLGIQGIQTLHHFLDTQMPFPYVHMITLLVNLHNMLVAAVAGLKFGIALERNSLGDCAAQIIQVLVVPTLYMGLLQVTNLLSNPMGEDIIDFPILEYQLEVSESCSTMLKNGRFLYEKRWVEGLSPLPNANPIKELPVRGTVPGGPPAPVAPKPKEAAAPAPQAPAPAPAPPLPPTDIRVVEVDPACIAEPLERVKQQLRQLQQTVAGCASLFSAGAAPTIQYPAGVGQR